MDQESGKGEEATDLKNSQGRYHRRPVVPVSSMEIELTEEWAVVASGEEGG
jgi:hypothetical protein